MEEMDRTKMCQFCDGNIPMEAANCPYCGQSVMDCVRESKEQEELQEAMAIASEQEGIEDRFAPPYAPPYSLERDIKLKQSTPQSNVNDPFAAHKNQFAQNEMEQKKSKFAFKPPTFKTVNKERETVKAQAPEEPRTQDLPKPKKVANSAKKETLSVLFLSLGAQLFAIGLLLLFFSTDGHLTLEWRAKNWYLYCLVALPLLGFGWYSVREKITSA
ncbi:MAG: hypothetical protein P0S95_05285 [Rhabdochlamydiaceae bacterium]|nr:hypothetical protein [Candidatus Amphrikana amoebophyrae]